MSDLEWFRYSEVNGRVSMLVNDRLLIFWEKMAILSSGRRVSKNKKLPWPFWKWSATALPVTVTRMTCMRYSRFVDALYPFKLNPGGAYALSLDICFGSLSCPPKHVSTHFKASLPEKWPMLCLNEGVYRWHGNLVTLCKLRSQPLTRFLVGFIAVAQQIIWDIQQHLGLIME